MSLPRRCGFVLVLTWIIVNLQLSDLLPGGRVFTDAASVRSGRRRQTPQHNPPRDQPPVSTDPTCFAKTFVHKCFLFYLP